VAVGDRRGRRRAETIQEILRVAVEVMAAEGVAALSLSEVARRIGIQPPSLYKYFPSKLAVYDALFAQGAQAVLAEFRAAVEAAEPGLPALAAGVEGLARYALGNPVYAQLLYWRPVPGFVPSAEAFRPAQEFVAEMAAVLREAADRGQLGPDAAGEEGQAVLAAMVGGALSQQAANEPDAGFDDGRYVRLLPRLLEMFIASYPARESGA
jgi:AcrR family transcriptional regulator